MIDTNLTSAFIGEPRRLSDMKKPGGGKIINIGSMMSIFGAAFAPAYAPPRAASCSSRKSMATAWAPDNIQVNAVLPGWIDTELTTNARREVPGLHERVLARIPDGRWGAGDDMAGIAVFLASRPRTTSRGRRSRSMAAIRS